MKKIISVLLLTCTLILCITSCGNNNNNDSYNNNPPAENCTTTGIHTYEKGVCTGCGIKIFDIMKDYIRQNAENVSGSRYLCYSGSYTDDSNFTIFEYDSSKECIVILARMDYLLCTYSTDIYFTSYSLEDGVYDWDGSCITYNCNEGCTDLSGTLDPSKFTKSTTRLSHSSSVSNADRMAEHYADSLITNLNQEIIPFLETIGYNITIQDLGFTLYK